jgi:nucleoside-triphosphatase
MVKVLKIGITGLPKAGKTKTLLKTIEMLESEGLKVGGMVTEEIEEDGKRLGFYIMDWVTKEKDIMAHVDIEAESRQRVENYGVNVEAIDRIGVPAIIRAFEDDDIDVVVIDEIGRMEILSEKFVELVRDSFDEEKPIIITLHKKSRNPLLQDVRRREDVRILEVTPINQSILPYKIVKLIKEELKSLGRL